MGRIRVMGVGAQQAAGMRNRCRRTHCSFCDSVIFLPNRGLQRKTSGEFSYFLAHSPVHLNRNQLFAFSLLQHVSEENLASGLAIIENKNILLCPENSTTGNKRTPASVLRLPGLHFSSISALSPSPLGSRFKIP